MWDNYYKLDQRLQLARNDPTLEGTWYKKVGGLSVGREIASLIGVN